MVDHHTRRSVLTLAGASGMTLAGCLDSDGDDTDDTNDTNDTDGTPEEDGPTDEPTNETETGEDETDPADMEVEGSPLEASFEEVVAVSNLELPWDIAFAPTGDVFFTERSGRIRHTTIEVLSGDSPTDESEIDTDQIDLPGVVTDSEGGTLGIAVHPEYPEPAYVYVFYTAMLEERVDRVARYDATTQDDVEIIVDGLPGKGYHNGGRIRFGPDGLLWITRGDTHEPDQAQNPDTPVGTLLRVSEEGEPRGSDEAPPDADPRVVTYGHRNMQGLDWLPDGTPIATEHGPDARDEVQLLSPGNNYGWPTARGGPDDSEYGAYGETPEFAPPIASSGTEVTWAPSGGSWYGDDALPYLRNRFLFGGLRSRQLHVLTLLDQETEPPDDATAVYGEDWYDDRYLAVRHELLVEEYGRIRHVAQGPEGAIYLLTSNRGGRAEPTEQDDIILRLDPET